jgi:hypothetical protein
MSPRKRRQYKLYTHGVITEQLRESEYIVRNNSMPNDLGEFTALENEVQVTL